MQKGAKQNKWDKNQGYPIYNKECILNLYAVDVD